MTRQIKRLCNRFTILSWLLHDTPHETRASCFVRNNLMVFEKESIIILALINQNCGKLRTPHETRCPCFVRMNLIAIRVELIIIFARIIQNDRSLYRDSEVEMWVVSMKLIIIDDKYDSPRTCKIDKLLFETYTLQFSERP